MLELQKKNDGSIVGHIYEYLTVSSLEVASVADFYITDEYVTVVGNKADGMIGFDGYICELYSVSSGRMIGYEVKETLSVAGVGVTYNTLWFDLEDIDGITSVKHIPADSLKEEDKIYINGKASLWETKNFGISGGAKMASRRFDIEFRTQHFYYYDEANEKYEIIKTKVPMLFIQEEVFEDFEDDIKSTNNINASVNVSSAQLDKLMSEYSSKIDLVAENKDKYSVENIVDYIGNKIRF